jgi:CheY-like chemotaxis protein
MNLMIASVISRATIIQNVSHWITITFCFELKGSILEATRTLTGYAPEVLLMTSVYDTLYDEDLPGFLCIKTQFWDKRQSDVEAFIRRRTIDGDWLWLASKAISYINEGEIHATIIEETLIPDDQIDIAQLLNRITRITAILIQAVEAAWLAKAKSNHRQTDVGDLRQSITITDNNFLEYEEDGAAYQAVLDAIQSQGMDIPENVQELQNLVLATQFAETNPGQGSKPLTQQPKMDPESTLTLGTAHEKSFDPNAVIESVRTGVRLDFGMIRLDPDEARVIGLVLAGLIPVDQLAPVVLTSFVMGFGMRGVADHFITEAEMNTRMSPSPVELSRSSSTTPSSRDRDSMNMPIDTPPRTLPPPITVLNFSYTYIGNMGIEMLAIALYQENSCLNTLDVSFCGIDEKGMLTLARALVRRNKKKIPMLKGLFLSGNYITPRSATEIGCALSASDGYTHKRSRKRRVGYNSDDTESSDEEDDYEESTRKRRKAQKRQSDEFHPQRKTEGLQVLHIAHCSMTAEAISRLLEGLGVDCTIRELNLSSNYFGVDGATALLKFLEPKQRNRGAKPGGGATMPYLDRLDVSNNKLGDEGTTQLTRAILVRASVHLVDLRLSSNSIGSGGIETIMNKLLQHNLISLSLDNNTIGDQGCQLVAASLQSMQSLARLNLGFNHIGCRGITSLMRSIVVCKAMRYLGLSGNLLRINGAFALAFTLSQHPRLEELDVDNCCLGQAAQCHIVAGIISNRWVPMKRLKGYALGPPMVAIGALKPVAANLSNEECLRIRKDEQMKTILQWMETNRTVKNQTSSQGQQETYAPSDTHSSQFLTPDFVSRTNEMHGTPSQNAYLRLLGWLSRIPFDDDELSALQMYFYDQDLDGDRGSDGHINLKLRGDLLAALDEKAADEIREDVPALEPSLQGPAGINLDKLYCESVENSWTTYLQHGYYDDEPEESASEGDNDSPANQHSVKSGTKEAAATSLETETIRKDDIKTIESTPSLSGRERKGGRLKPRITMFPQFEQQLIGLKASATELLEQEEDPIQHEVILTQYAEASLTILRQLRYHCMNSGLDGWRQSGLTRKVLIVDDSMVTRKLVSRAFEKANFIVDTACNGVEGVEKLKTSLYDIAFMDIDMPVMNGFEATKQLREWEDVMRPGARQPICALTATYVDDFHRSELMKFKDAGLDVMESKPCNIPRLFKVVDDVAPMFSDLSISVMQREQSDQSFQSDPSPKSSFSM